MKPHRLEVLINQANEKPKRPNWPFVELQTVSVLHSVK